MKIIKVENSSLCYPVFWIAVACVLLTFLGCSTTSKQNGSSSGEAATDRFAQADKNHDGKLSPDEASDYFVALIFVSRDFNHDEVLTWEEWNVPGADRSRAKFDTADTDKDGKLSLEEALAYGRKRHAFQKEFQQADTNHDGYVTREEAKAYAADTEGPPR
jgi:Ca2+-binding EF-hand superfamily protein